VSARVCVCVVCLLIANARPCDAQTARVGEVSFENSGVRGAQASFLTGLAQLHNFEYADAADWFQRAERTDPSFALAYWGEAMTFNHPVWMEQDLAAARRVLLRLGPTREARIEKAKTEREKAYLRAVELLYGDGDKYARDAAYAAAMADVHERYPDDVDATALSALALLGTAHEGRNVATYMRAAALLEAVFPTHPTHPGIAHYLIHAYDDPVHAPLGMRAARAYSKIAPAAGHAQHMCSHIFLAMGLWDDLVASNEAAIRVVDQQRSARQRSPVACGHYPSWLEYGYLQQGRWTAAKQLVAQCRAIPRPNGAPADADKLTIDSFVTMRARYVMDTQDFGSEVLDWSVPGVGRRDADVLNAFVEGYVAFHTKRDAAAALGRLRDARAALDAQLESAPPPDGSGSSARAWANVLELELLALVRAADGDREHAIADLRKAATIEDSVPYEFGPPFVDKPPYELLGEMLLAFGRPHEARVAFEQALARTPERPAALTGLMQAAEHTGDSALAARIRVRLHAIRHAADVRGTAWP
jgi:tetratricopeptide (TPR) repeat protein